MQRLRAEESVPTRLRQETFFRRASKIAVHLFEELHLITSFFVLISNRIKLKEVIALYYAVVEKKEDEKLRAPAADISLTATKSSS